MLHKSTWFAFVMGLGLAAACGGDDETGRIDVEVVYPNAGAENITGSLHLWVLRPGSGDEAAGCAALVAEEVDPYALEFDRIVDDVFLQPDEPDIFAEKVPRRRVLVYVEGVDFIGVTHLAGCVDTSVNSSTVSVQVLMSSPGTFDCADPATENDAPCDDGDLCTVNEKCSGSSCGGGVARNCDFLADDCNAASCDSEVGCVATPLSNGQSCNDTLFCTSGDICTDGVCGGGPTDCSAVENGCTVGTCDEAFDQCVPVPVGDGTGCDLFCTVGGICVSGACSGGVARDCSGVEDQCNASTCDEDADQCVPVPLTGPTCDDANACTTGESCVAGGCGGGVADFDNDGFTFDVCPAGSLGNGDCDDQDITVNPNATEGPLGDATCTDLKDNDCDGNTDAADTNCQ